VNDRALAVLREVGLLHTLSLATTADRKRPADPAGVTSLNLFGTKVTGAGLKELAGFKNLTTINLTPFDVDDEVLAALREVDLLHALVMARGDRGVRPAKSDDVLTLNLSLTKVSDTGLKELTGLKNLSELNLFGSKVTNAGVKALQKELPGCKIRQ
jgi:hypothetical protein